MVYTAAAPGAAADAAGHPGPVRHPPAPPAARGHLRRGRVRRSGRRSVTRSRCGSRPSTAPWPRSLAAADATNTPLGDLVLSSRARSSQVLRFPHRFQLILFMIAPLVMSLTLAFAIDAVTRASGSLVGTEAARPTRLDAPARRGARGAKDALIMLLAGHLCIGSVFFTPFWSNAAVPKSLRLGQLRRASCRPTRSHDLKELKQALKTLPEGKTVVLPPTETAKLVTDERRRPQVHRQVLHLLPRPAELLLRPDRRHRRTSSSSS